MKIISKPTYKQYEAWRVLDDNKTQFLLFGGGAGGGKSWLGAEWLVRNCYAYPKSKWFIARNELSRLIKSSYITFIKVCDFHKIPTKDWKYNGQWNYIEFKNGSRIDLLDLAHKPSDPNYTRLGSLEYTGGWIEEANEVPFMAYDIIKSRLGRHLNKEFNLLPPKLLLTCNPSKEWIYRVFYKPHKDHTLEPNFRFIQSLYRDNPHTAQEYEEQLKQLNDTNAKERLMYGNWEFDDDPAKMIEFEAILDLFTNQVDYDEKKYLTADIARFGRDKTVLMVWQGMKVTRIETLSKKNTEQVAEAIRTIAAKEKIPYSKIIIDEDGVGGGVVDKLQGVKGFVNNSSALNQRGQKKNYANLKAQCTDIMANLINSHKICVDTRDEQIKSDLIEELEQIKKKDVDKEGKFQLRPKDEIKEVLGRSPDFSDALMMRMFFELRPGPAKESSIPEWQGYKRKNNVPYHNGYGRRF